MFLKIIKINNVVANIQEMNEKTTCNSFKKFSHGFIISFPPPIVIYPSQ